MREFMGQVRLASRLPTDDRPNHFSRDGFREPFRAMTPARIVRPLLLAMYLFPVLTAEGQSRVISLTADNDAFNFWRTAGSRPDEEYTSGVRLRYEGGSIPFWAGRLSHRAACAGQGTDTSCVGRRTDLAQKIFTPRRTDDDPITHPGSRANAAWLYVEDAARFLARSHATEVSVAVGVTGPPALGSFAQRFAHSFAPGFNKPIDWSTQIGFEPGVIVRYAYTRRLGRDGIEILPRVAAEAGNITTAAEVGVRMRTGINLQHAWLAPSIARQIELAFVVGMTGRAIARDIFLDGNSFDDRLQVGHEPLTAGAEWSATLRYSWAFVSYGTVVESRSYARGPVRHAWSSLTAGIRVSSKQ
jgi:hypothetical protein